MIRRTSILFLEVTLAVAVVLSLLIAGSVWRLSQRPLSLQFLLPYAMGVLDGQKNAVRVELDDLILAWGGWERALDIRALGVRLRTRENLPVARIREVSVSFSFRALLAGRLAPTSLELIRPLVVLSRDTNGGVEMGLGEPGRAGQDAAPGAAPDESSGESSGTLLPLLLNELSGPPQKDSSLRYLNRVSVLGAGLRVDDRKLGVSWAARRADITLRRAVSGLRVHYDLELDLGESAPRLVGDAAYDKAGEQVDVDLRFLRLGTVALASQVAALRDIAALRARFDGGLSGKIGLDGGIRQARFRADSGPGSFAVPGSAAAPIAFRRISVGGSVSRNPGQLLIEHADVDFGKTQVGARAVVTRVGDIAAVSASMDLRDLPMNDLGTYWIPGLADNARDWVVRNMRDGLVTEGEANLTARVAFGGATPGETTVDSVNGRFSLTGATVDYLSPMPPIRGASAKATFSSKRFDFAVSSGGIGDLRLEEGSVNIWDIGEKQEMLATSALIRGPVRDALALVGHPRLNLLSRVGLSEAGAAGRHATRLSIALPLLAGLKAEQVAVSATSNIVGLVLPNVLKGEGVSDGKLSLAIDNRHMQANGEVRFTDTPVRFVWEELFPARSAVRRRLTASLTLDQRQRRMFDVDFPDILTGPVPAKIAYEERRDGGQSVSGDLDLAAAKLDVPGFDWAKLPGRPGKASFRALLGGGGITGIPSFSVEAGVFQAAGKVAFDPAGGAFRSLTLDRFALGASEFSGTAAYDADRQLAVTLRGEGLDATSFIARRPAGTPSPVLPPFTLDGTFDKMWLGSGAPVTGVRLALRRGPADWREFMVSAGLPPSGKPLTVKLAPTATGQEMTLYAADAGAFLESLDLTDTIHDGAIELKAVRGADPFAPWKGTAEMKLFSVADAPNLARILTLASLTGIVDVLSGNGIAFDYLTLPFEYAGEVARITDAKAVGSELGITASGTVDFAKDAIDLGGTLIPAYTLNSLIGKIPLLGPIITGEKGGGIFAASYQVKGALAAPQISVNPLSALAPGFLRNLFGGGSPSAPAEDDRPAAPSETPKPGRR